MIDEYANEFPLVLPEGSKIRVAEGRAGLPRWVLAMVGMIYTVGHCASCAPEDIRLVSCAGERGWTIDRRSLRQFFVVVQLAQEDVPAGQDAIGEVFCQALEGMGRCVMPARAGAGEGGTVTTDEELRINLIALYLSHRDLAKTCGDPVNAEWHARHASYYWKLYHALRF